MILLGIIAVNLTIQTAKDVGFIPQAEAQQLGILEYDMVTRRVMSEVMPTVLRDNAADVINTIRPEREALEGKVIER